jgi:hypothetical protein
LAELVYSVEDIFNSYLEQEGKKVYNLPVYQRGYKWSTKEVNKLLEDIDGFQISGNSFYCLQNITIVPKETDSFNVVDGQQRLTTLYILLSYLGETELVDGKISYPKNSIRTKTYEFLRDSIINIKYSNTFNQNWMTFLEGKEEFNHQDIFYLYNAAQTIKKWFESKDDNYKENFTKKLKKHVKLIVNNIRGAEEERVFGNLNSKRIPLDGADLVRAMLITRVANEEVQSTCDIKNIVRLNERRVRIGWELDELNKWWGDPEVSLYFEKFISVRQDDDIHFNLDRHPINRLLSLYVQKEKESKLTLEFFEKPKDKINYLTFYKSIHKFHIILKDWYHDRKIYHYLGFLFFQIGIKFEQVWKFWIEAKSREVFIQILEKTIKNELFGNEPITSNKKDWDEIYKDNPKFLVKILLLLDVIHSLKGEKGKLPVVAFSRANNDIEHIFPQNPKREKEKELKEYIDFLNKHVVSDNQPFDSSKLKDTQSIEDYRDEIDQFIDKHTRDISIHSIGNLVLLDSSINRSISNNSFAYKRNRIIEAFNKAPYLQPHTFRVFVRYFYTSSNESKDLERWTKEDIEKNEEKIKAILDEYFMGV